MTNINLPEGYAIDLILEPEEEYPLVLLLLEEDTGKILEALGGIDVPYTVSDHGNIHVLTEQGWDYLTYLALELIEEIYP